MLSISLVASLADTRECIMATHAGPHRWPCPINQFCGEIGQCSGFGCGGPNNATCPSGLDCCDTGPVQPGGASISRGTQDPAHFCRNPVNETCCGIHNPQCRKDQGCCLTTARLANAAAAGVQYQPSFYAAAWCADTDASPPNPAYPYGPGSCCLDSAGNLSYACVSGVCCGTDPAVRPYLQTGVNDCIDPNHQQCCRGDRDPGFPCPDCGWGCSTKRVCGARLGSCETSAACSTALQHLCPDRSSLTACERCVGEHIVSLKGKCLDPDDFDSYCSGPPAAPPPP